jgi:heme-degrading monooxygenase HmoA
MSPPTLILLVRFASELSLEEAIEVMNARAPEFAALPGLRQKYYLQDDVTGELAGLYLWDSAEDFSAYRESELRATIAKAYRVKGEPRIEIYQVLRPLRDDDRRAID